MKLTINSSPSKIKIRQKVSLCTALRASDETAIKFLVTSRPLRHIADEFSEITQKLPTIHLAGEEDTDQIKCEIDLVINAELKILRQKRRLDSEAISRLQQELTKFEHRTYLWLKLVFELIRNNIDSATKKGRRKIFGTIPGSVHAAYTAILNQSTDKEEAKKILQIVCTAIRPLSVREMSIAISIQPEDETLKDLEIQSDDYSEKWIRELCGLFVSIIDGRVYLLHQTAKEFLIGEKELSQSTTASDWIWKHSLSVKDSHFVLVHICMWYLRLEGFSIEHQSPELSETDDELFETVNELISTYDFLEYAAKNWAIHFREAAIPMDHISIGLALSICNPQAYPYTTWGLVYWKTSIYDTLPTKLSNLHLASQFGHQGVVGRLLAAPEIDINKADGVGRTPLWRAASKGYANVVSQLLAAPGIDVNKANRDGWTPLFWAASERYADIVSQLLAAPGIDVNKADTRNWTPLFYAAYKGYADVVSQLLAAPGIDVNKVNRRGWTPLFYAAYKGYADVVSQLLAVPGIDVNKADIDSRTPLLWAASRGRADVMSQLLAVPGIDVNKTEPSGWTPLLSAAYEGHANIVSQLLEKGADPEFKNKRGQTLLSQAAERGQEVAVKLFLAVDLVKPDSKDRIGRTPLMYAAKNGNKAIVELLITTTRVSVDSKDYYESTALSVAARRGHKDVVAFLLPKCYSLNAQDAFCRTALWWARKNGYPEIADLLLEEYQENSITIQEDDLPITTIPVLSNNDSGYCDVCVLDISDENTYYHCKVCSSGDFCICEECFVLKAHCLDKSHKLVKKCPSDI